MSIQFDQEVIDRKNPIMGKLGDFYDKEIKKKVLEER